MTGDWAVVLTLTRAILLLLGLATTAVSFRAYLREGTRYLRDATIGFAFITFGVLIEGFLYQLTALTLTQVHVAESVAIACGFLVLLRSFLR
ncbi:hypothetical protein SAMN04488067_1105 [Halorubrum xinjiangense]|uniref:Uncharacterized protein n=1 Tax=Halorubrum xinjiangense TaxID=261291 RepID=A0A1G7PKU4_9EURY|nr:hypothetical protein [Halorubrum xinjiangense]SDF86916.1 hypothetical protein SAMN04488067_1105 [Halorubrum xinjiangense]